MLPYISRASTPSPNSLPSLLQTHVDHHWRLVPLGPPRPAFPPPSSSTVFLPPYPGCRRRSATAPACFLVAAGGMLLPATFLDHLPRPSPSSSARTAPSPPLSRPPLGLSSPPPATALPWAGAISSGLPSSLSSGAADPHSWPSRSFPTSLSQPWHCPSRGCFEQPSSERAPLPACSLRRDRLLLASSSLQDLPPPFFPLS